MIRIFSGLLASKRRGALHKCWSGKQNGKPSPWLLKFSARRLVDLAVACLACTAYGISLFSIAIGGFWTGPDFDHAPMSGLTCLLSGWVHFPIGWLANPAFCTGVVLLVFRFRIAAFLSATAGIGLAWLWTCEFCRQFPAELLMNGYRWWLFSMQLLLLGTLCSMIVHSSETWQSVRLFCRAWREGGS